MTTLKCNFCPYEEHREFSESVQRRGMMIHIEAEHFDKLCKRI